MSRYDPHDPLFNAFNHARDFQVQREHMGTIHTAEAAITVHARISRWIPAGTIAVISEKPHEFIVLSRSALSNDELIAAIGGWYIKSQDAQELANLREDCEAGMNLDAARKVIKDIEMIAFWERISRLLQINRDEGAHL